MILVFMFHVSLFHKMSMELQNILINKSFVL